MRVSYSDIAIIVTSVLILIGTALTFESDFVWVGQDLAGIPSLFFLVATVIVGAMMVGRLKRSQNVNLLRLHRKIGVFFAILILATFLHGIWDRIYHSELFFWQHGSPLVPVVHGWLGLVVMLLAFVQVVSSLTIKDRQKLRGIHKVLGYTLLMLVIIQIFLGVEAVFFELAGG